MPLPAAGARNGSSLAVPGLRDRLCEGDLESLGSGVPYLIVRGHHMKDGFDSDEFIAALR